MRVAIIIEKKKQKITNVGKDVKKFELLYLVGMQKWHLLKKKS